MGDCQHDVIPREPPAESQGACARPKGPTQVQERAPELGAAPEPGERAAAEDSEALAPPQPQRGDAVSPSNVCHTVFEEQAKVAEECMQYYREMINKLEDILEASQPDTGGLATKIGEHWWSWLQQFGKARVFRTSPSVGWRWLSLFI